MRRRATRTLVTLVLLVGLSGCERRSAPGRPDDAANDADQSVASSDLRLAAERGFGLHTLTIAESLRNAVLERQGSPARWTRGTAETLAAVVAPFDEAAAGAVGAAWAKLAEAAQTFAGAAEDERDQAREDLEGVAEETARVLSATTDGTWPADEATSALRTHVVGLSGYVDAVDERDHETALTALREEHARMIAVGGEWAAALADPYEGVDPTAMDTPATELRSALAQLLTEQAALAGAGMRRVARGARDAEATLAAVNGNTNDLAAAMRVILGAGSARDLELAWRGRVELLVADAAGLDDDAEQERAAQGLRRITRELVDVLSEATGDALDAEAATTALRAQTRALHAQTAAIIDDQPGAYPG